MQKALDDETDISDAMGGDSFSWGSKQDDGGGGAVPSAPEGLTKIVIAKRTKVQTQRIPTPLKGFSL